MHFRTASLSKSFAGRAGIIACADRNAEFIKYHSNPAIFSSGLMAHEIVILDETRRQIMRADRERKTLQESAAYLRGGLAALGYNVDASETQIISLAPGEEFRTIELRNALESMGIFGSVFCAPATAKNHSLIRFTVNSGLTRDQLDRVITACAEIRSEVRVDEWSSTRRKQRRRALSASESRRRKRDRALIA